MVKKYTLLCKKNQARIGEKKKTKHKCLFNLFFQMRKEFLVIWFLYLKMKVEIKLDFFVPVRVGCVTSQMYFPFSLYCFQ